MLCGCIALLAFLNASAQIYEYDDEEYDEDPASPKGVLVGVKGGLVISSPRQVFPSIRIGDAVQGTGEISSRFGETGLGHRIALDLLIPFNERLAFTADAGLHTYAARYAADSGRLPLRLDVQMLQVAGGMAGNIYVDREGFESGGFRNIYIAGALEVGVQTLANHVDGFTFDSTGAPQPASGSFDNTEPFRTLVGLRFTGGIRYGLDTHLELLAETSYAFALNPIFSKAVVRDNSFTIDNIIVQLGAGYRF